MYVFSFLRLLSFRALCTGVAIRTYIRVCFFLLLPFLCVYTRKYARDFALVALNNPPLGHEIHPRAVIVDGNATNSIPLPRDVHNAFVKT